MGSDTAIQTSDLTLIGGDPQARSDAVRLAHRTLKSIKWSLFWAFDSPVTALPLTVFGQLNPMINEFIRAASSIFAMADSPRLRSSP